MPAPDLFDWPAIANRIYVWVRDASGVTVVWAGQKTPRPESPYITIRRLGGIRAEGFPGELAQDSTTQPRIVLVTVANATEPAYSITIPDPGNDPDVFSHTRQGGDTTTTIRDALVTALASSGLTVAAVGAAQLRITGDFGYQLSAGLTAVVEREELELTSEALGVVAISLQAHVDRVDAQGNDVDVVDTDAVSYLDRIVNALQLPEWRARLVEMEWTGEVQGPTDITGLVGTTQQSRATATISFRVHGSATEEVGTIREADVELITE